MGDVLLLDPLGDVGLAKLPDLIRALMDQRDMSYSDVAARSGIPRSTVHLIASGRHVHAPKAAHIEALASALGAPAALLQDAVAADYGLATSRTWQISDESDETTRQIVATLAGLTPDDRDTALALIAALRERAERAAAKPRKRTARTRKADNPDG